MFENLQDRKKSDLTRKVQPPKQENQKTRRLLAVFVFLRFRLFAFSCLHVQSWRFSVLAFSRLTCFRVFVFLCWNHHVRGQSGLLRYILFTCPKLRNRSCSKCYGMDCFGILYTCPRLWYRSCSKCYGMDCSDTYSTHAQGCDNVAVQTATERTASVHTLHMPKAVAVVRVDERVEAPGFWVKKP